MKSVLKTVLLLSVVMILFFMAACSSANNNAANNGKSDNATTPDSQPAKESLSEDNEPVDPLGKYETPIEVTLSRPIDSSYSFPEGQSIDKNVWYDEVAEVLGINVTNKWTANDEQYDQKMNVTIASGDLPDIMSSVKGYQLEQLVEGGMVADLTEAYEKYASPLLKDLMTQNGGVAFETAKFDGKIMALPRDIGNLDGLSMVWVRKDWLDKLGLEPPKTMDDFLKISTAFTEQDPDGNGKDDTFGIGMTKKFYEAGFFEIIPFFNGYHAYPQQWIENDQGELVYGSVQPEMRDALEQLQKMFNEGQIDPEFAVKDKGKEGELAGTNRLGMFYGKTWNPIFPLKSYLDKDPDMVWQSYPIVSVDQQVALPQISLKPTGYYVVREGYEHPESLIKMMNYFAEIRVNATTEQFEKLLSIPKDDGTNFEAFKYTPVEFIVPDKNHKIYLAVNEALESKDASKLNPEMMKVYEDILSYQDGNNDHWPFWSIQLKGEGHSRTVLAQYIDDEQYLPDAFLGNETETMVAKLPTLEKMEVEVFMKIVMGDPITKFDEFVENWKELGGDQVTEEVNEWYQTTK